MTEIEKPKYADEDYKDVLEKVREELNEDKFFSKLIEEYDVTGDLEFNEFNIKERLEQNSFYQKHFKLKYLQELSKVQQVREHLEKKTGEFYEELKHGQVQLSKQEIERYYIPKEPNLLKIKSLLRKAEMRAQFFEAVFEAFKSQSWNMKSYIEQNKGGF